jgi:hypothetical protein
MRTEALIQDHADKTSSRQFRVSDETKFFRAEEVEARIQHVCDRYKNLNSASRTVWLESGPHICNPELDLHVKVEAVRWMLRIAKHMSEPAREVVFLRIENSLRQLESAVEPRVHHIESGARTERLYRSAHA